VFGIIRPCRHRLGGDLAAAWQAHLCGMCLSLRDDHGQAARLATNYDGLVISVLAEAQADGAPERRTAGRCALRRMRKLDVAVGDCARLAATVSLILAAAKIRDHADDGDGAFGRPGVRGAATALADRWAVAGTRTGRELGFEVGVLTEAIGRRAGHPAARGHRADRDRDGRGVRAHGGAGGPVRQRGAARRGGTALRPDRHLVDAVEDLVADQASGAWNPLLATGTDLTEARRLCDDALLGIKLALNEAEFTDARLVHTLLVHELARSVRRVFAAPSGATGALAATVSSPGCGLPAAAGLSGLLAIRRRRGCCEDCCCDCGEDCCCECSCDACCGDGCCGDGCCDCSC
jgi:hypothetical protein